MSPAKFYRLPWRDGTNPNAGYSFQDIPLSTFQEPDKLRGEVAEIIVNPQITDSTVAGQEPIGRWVRQGDVMIPADSITQQAATIYAHLEKLAEIDRSTGVLSKMNGRSKIGLLSEIAESASAPLILNNAVYDGHLDALFVVPYSGDLLAIALNPGIIGHEHFHRVFQAVVLSQIREAARTGSIPYGWDETIHCINTSTLTIDGRKVEQPEALPFGDTNKILVPTKILNQAIVRGMNEGFADFWGWSYSRDEAFAGRSLGEGIDRVRRLDVTIASLPKQTEFRNNLVTINSIGLPVLKNEGGRVDAAYQLGTQYARTLRSVVEALVANGKVDREVAITKVRYALAQALGSVGTDIVTKWGHEDIDPELLLKPVFKKLVVMSGDGPAVLEADTANVVCKELVRLNASQNLTQGLCGALAK